MREAFGVISSPFILGTIIGEYLKDSTSYLAEELMKNKYVDNAPISANSKEHADEIHCETRRIFTDPGMNKREYLSNCLEFNDAIPDDAI